MESKHSFLLSLYILFFLPVFLFLPPAVYAGDESYYMERDGDEVHFFQRLAWKADQNALYYEVVVEQDEGKGFQEIMRVTMEDTAVEVSFNPGYFRYHVVAYDLLDRPGVTPEWTYFEIIPAMEPIITGISPLVLYLDEDDDWTLTLTGKNLEEGAKACLRRPGSNFEEIVPTDYSTGAGASQASMNFNGQPLNPGIYEVYFKNPGGLDTSFGTLTVSFRSPISLYVSAAYSPLFSLHGTVKDIFDTFVFPQGASAHITFIPIKLSIGMFGLELSVGWHRMYADLPFYEVSMSELEAGLGLVYQRWLPNRSMAWIFRAGGGVVSALNFDFVFGDGNSQSVNLLCPQIYLGASFVWMVKRPLYLEAGIDFVEWLLADSLSGQMRPRIGAGWRF
jgi:hypothetical protein